MARIVAGIAAILFIAAGAFLITRGSSAASENRLEDTPAPAALAEAEEPAALPVIPEIPEPPAADPLTKEQKRFNRKDKNGDEAIDLSEMVHSRRTRFANLDRDGNGELRFEEWAITTIEKFEEADADGNSLLSRSEYATTAPKPRKKKPKCSC